MIKVFLYHDKNGKKSFCGTDSFGFFDGRKTLRTCIIEQKNRFIREKRITGEYNNGYARFFMGGILNPSYISDFVYVGDIKKEDYDTVVDEKLKNLYGIV